MENSLKKDGKAIKKGKQMKPPKKQDPIRIAVVGGLRFFFFSLTNLQETINIEVDVTNPLQVPLQFTQMQLVGVYTPRAVGASVVTKDLGKDF